MIFCSRERQPIYHYITILRTAIDKACWILWGIPFGARLGAPGVSHRYQGLCSPSARREVGPGGRLLPESHVGANEWRSFSKPWGITFVCTKRWLQSLQYLWSESPSGAFGPPWCQGWRGGDRRGTTTVFETGLHWKLDKRGQQTSLCRVIFEELICFPAVATAVVRFLTLSLRRICRL